ncbi:serine--tRNA ligase 2 [Candidatus Dependentiae bacterium Noda2021]|nr:serine--tRNA ligase 2 [Candidatus Dependentiae bacterium Noda2021]
MIDLKLLRENPVQIIELLHIKEPSYDARKLYDLDAKVRQLRIEVESLRKKKNDLAQQAKSGVTPEIRTESMQISAVLKEKEVNLESLDKEFKLYYLSCPNIPAQDIPMGGKDSNKVVKTFGEKPTFNFPVKNHLELGTALKWFDFETAAQITAGNFPLYKGDGVKVIYALTMFMLKNNMKFGFEPILPSYLVNEQSLTVASNFPKFKDQVFAVTEDNIYLTPTAEVNLANMYRNKILNADELPIRMTSWTSCFRREAGGYGAHERGLIRMHQFEKVELFTVCTPEQSNQEQERMLACAESILQQLGLHYRVSLLAGQDCSFASAKTYDIEVWLPGQGMYYEVSSISNCTDFQARRGMIRYKKSADSSTELVNTLNGSSLALSRLMVAILEVYQQADGSVIIPEVLKNEGIF